MTIGDGWSLGRASFLLIIFSVALGIAGQVSLKYGVRMATEKTSFGSLDPGSVLTFLQGAAANKFVLLGFVCYLISAASWLVILSRVPLSIAYPMISIGYIVVVMLSKHVDHKPVTALQIAGTLLICAGVFLLGRS
jgi:multidrug transporter EmrE-like cation transporter